ATVNVSPGDDIESALYEAAFGGTVIFAPGWYDLTPVDPGSQRGIYLSSAHENITLKGAGWGTDPATATILDGEAWFIDTAFRIETVDVVIEGFTIVNIYDEAVECNSDAYNVEFRNCMFLACDSGSDNDGTAGMGDFDFFDEMIRFKNCIFARGGDDGSDQEGDSAVLYQNCDFYDWDSDIFDHEDNSIIVAKNCIFHAGSLSDDLDGGSGTTEMLNCVFFDPPGEDADGLGGMAIEGGAYEVDGVGGDPLYVNVGPHVFWLDLDFHLQEGSPALTAGKDDDGNATFAGSMGPAQ
ncbi:MAG: hypothetical protein ACP5I1_14880, partial [Candidatus Hinthialibacter sp.]